MSQILYAVPSRFTGYSLGLRSGKGNPGGGISTKVHRVCEVWREYYDVNMTDRFWEYPSCHTLVMDPLTVSLSENPVECLENYAAYTCKIKVLYCSEQALLLLPFEIREGLIKASTVVTHSCDFQRVQFDMLGYPTVPLCDPIPPVFLDRGSKKELEVLGIGNISYEKNVAELIEVFRLLRLRGVATTYVGGSNLWGETNSESLRLEIELRKYCSNFYRNVSQDGVVSALRRASCGVFLTKHETCSESNQECLMAGLLNFYGGHRLWLERPGVHDLGSAEEVVDAISRVTHGFSKIPAEALRCEAEDWAVRNCSYEQFLNQWKEVMNYAL